VDAAASLPLLRTLKLAACGLSCDSAPALARLLSSGTLTALSIEHTPSSTAVQVELRQLFHHPALLDAPAATLLGDALRANATLTSLTLRGTRLWADHAAAAALLGALTGHASVRTLTISERATSPWVAQHNAAQPPVSDDDRRRMGALPGALLAANAPALTALDDVSRSDLRDAGLLAPLFERRCRTTRTCARSRAGAVAAAPTRSRLACCCRRCAPTRACARSTRTVWATSRRTSPRARRRRSWRAAAEHASGSTSLTVHYCSAARARWPAAACEEEEVRAWWFRAAARHAHAGRARRPEAAYFLATPLGALALRTLQVRTTDKQRSGVFTSWVAARAEEPAGSDAQKAARAAACAVSWQERRRAAALACWCARRRRRTTVTCAQHCWSAAETNELANMCAVIAHRTHKNVGVMPACSAAALARREKAGAAHGKRRRDDAAKKTWVRAWLLRAAKKGMVVRHREGRNDRSAKQLVATGRRRDGARKNSAARVVMSARVPMMPSTAAPGKRMP
jgi:hypothetical protein